MKLKHSDYPALALLCAAWVAAVVAVDPRGEYPILDDWAYARSVHALVSGQGFVLSDWTATNLVSQVLWGALFTLPFGYSVTALRVSTLVLGLIGGVTLFRLLRLAGAGRALALLGALALLFNPIYFWLAFSFMSDVPYVAMQIVAMWLLAGGVIFHDRLRLALGWTVGVAALLCRQVAVSIPLGFATESLLRRPRRMSALLAAAAPIVAFAAVQWAYTSWLTATENMPALFGRQINNIGASLLTSPLPTARGAIAFVVYCFHYLGIFLLPFTLPAISSWSAAIPSRWRAPAYASVASVAIAAFIGALVLDARFPMWAGGVISMNNGLGAGDNMGTPLDRTGTLILTALSSGGGALLLAATAGACLAWLRRPHASGADIALFAAATGAAVLAPVALIAMRFDRYLIPAIPCFLLALSVLLVRHPPSRASIWAGFVALTAMGAISTGATHDYLAAKRVHWHAYVELTRTVPTLRVDAGWIVNASSNFDLFPSMRRLRIWYNKADYIVTAGRRGGLDVVDTYAIDRWLPWNRDGAPIVVQRRLGAGRAPPQSSGTAHTERCTRAPQPEHCKRRSDSLIPGHDR